MELISELRAKGAAIAICNTVVSGDLAKLLDSQGIRVISLIHELPELIREYRMEGNAAIIARHASHVVFPSAFVRDKFEEVAHVDDSKAIILPQGLYLRNPYRYNKSAARREIRSEFGIPGSAKIVLAVGYADHRKGPDLFVDVAKRVIDADPGTYFLWMGHHDDRIMKALLSSIKGSMYEKNIFFPGICEDIARCYASADLYLMTSREDPFPSTVLEAMDAGVPVIGFKDAGGFSDIVTADTGALVPYLDTGAMAEKVLDLLQDEVARKRLGENASELIRTKYRFTDYVHSLLGLLGHDYRKVSAVVPNYNYAHYLPGRLKSILDQDYPVYEIIVLDDCSSDDSVKVINDFAAKAIIPVEVMVNGSNSGSVFRQWARGLAKAMGDYIWIAEADDLCEREFLTEVLGGFSDPDVVLSYCQSKQIDQHGNYLANDYLYYTNDVDDKKWKNDYVRDGLEEIRDTLAVKNTIPNVSGVVFRKFDLGDIVDQLVQFKVAGDLFFYVWLLQNGKISYRSRSLNIHRRHTGGVTLSENGQRHFEEIVKMQEYILEHFDVCGGTRLKIAQYREKVAAQLLGDGVTAIKE
jgi:glycosyltransferase involved in cell wall biosynthesis